MRGRERDRLRASPAVSSRRATAALRSPRLGAGLAGDVPDLEVRQRGAEARSGCRGWPRGEAVGCFGPDRARLRLRPGQHAHPRPARRRRLGPQRRRRCGSRTAGSPTWPSCGRRPTTASAASSSRTDTPGFTDARHPPQALPPSLDHHASCILRGRAASPTAPSLPGVDRACAAPLSCLSRGALRDLLGRRRRRHRLLPRRAGVRARPACSTASRSPPSSSPSASSST